MKAILFLLALLLTSPVQAITLGQMRPDLAGAMLGGGPTRLSQLHPGKPLLLAFFSVTCLPCLKEAPDLNRLATEFNGKLTLVYVSTDPESLRSKTPGFLQRAQSSLPVFYADSALVREAYEAYGLPKLVLADAQGSIRWMHEGYDPSLYQALRYELVQLGL